MMNIQSYRILLGAWLAVLAGASAAQAGGDTPYPPADRATQTQTQPLRQPVQTNTDTAAPTARLPATKEMAAPDGSSSPRTTATMPGHSMAQAPDQAGAPMHNPPKHAHHTAKRASRPDQTAARGETTYHQALRQCVKEQNQDQRDSCLDSAIEQFQRNG